MIERDDELGQALGELPVPDHGPGFWDRVQRAGEPPSAAGPTAGSSPGATRLDGHGHGGGGDGGGVEGDRSVVASGSSRRRPYPRWVALAAAVLVVVAGAGVVLRLAGDDGDGVVTVAGRGTEEGPPSRVGRAEDDAGAAAPSGTTGAGDEGEAPPGAGGFDVTTVTGAKPLGPGLAVGALPAADGTATVLVRDLLPGGGTGCEGAPLEGLLVLHADGTSTPVLAADGSPIANGADVVPAPGGDRVAVTSECEGFLTQLLVGRVGPDGVPTELEVVAGYPTGGETPVADAPALGEVPSVAWSADGSRLLVVELDGEGEPGPSVWSYDPATGRWSQEPAAPDDVLAAVVRADGSLAAITEDDVVVGGQVQPRDGATGLALAPDGQRVAVFGSNGLRLLGDEVVVALADQGPVLDARFLPDGGALLYTTLAGDDVELRVLPLPTDLNGEAGSTALGTSRWGWIRPLPDSSGVLVTVDGASDGDGYFRPAVERWDFARTG